MSNPQDGTAPVVSIVIPAYNCRLFIEETVRSIQAQSLAQWECIIVDDGSTDGTLPLIRELAAQDGRIRIVAQPNGGPASARNHGMSLINALHPERPNSLFSEKDPTVGLRPPWRP